jgi:hypothetical protein
MFKSTAGTLSVIKNTILRIGCVVREGGLEIRSAKSLPPYTTLPS